MDRTTSQTEELAGLIVEARKIVAFTGAGISTECGIPDFRSPGGLWSRMRPIEYSEFISSPTMRLEAWRRYFKVYDEMSRAAPGRGHRALARLAEDGKLAHVITQNIDNLHLASGIPADRILELHGNGTYARCLGCERRHDIAWARGIVETEGLPPACIACGGIVKAATVSFGQSMPQGIMELAYGLAEACDLFLVLGSSLTVFPAASLPGLAKRWGARLIIVNRDATDLDAIADLVIHADIGPALGEAVALARSESLVRNSGGFHDARAVKHL